MREEYEAWFIGKFGFPPMPIHSRVLDFCWVGYQAGRKANESEVAQLRQQLAEKDAEIKRINDGWSEANDRVLSCRIDGIGARDELQRKLVAKGQECEKIHQQLAEAQAKIDRLQMPDMSATEEKK